MSDICLRADAAFSERESLSRPSRFAEFMASVERAKQCAFVPEAASAQLAHAEAVVACVTRVFQQCRLWTRAFPSPLEVLDSPPASPPVCLVVGRRLGQADGLQAAVDCRHRWPQTAILLVARQATVESAVEALHQGLDSVLPIPASAAYVRRELCAALQRMAARSKSLDEHSSARARLQKLSPREREVLKLIVAGISNKLIASRMGLGLRTVEKYRRSIFQSLGVETAASAACLWATTNRVDVLH